MCICCCPTRKPLLIYAIVITGLTFIFGIITVALFGSSTDVHKFFVDVIDAIEDSKGRSSISNDIYDSLPSLDYNDLKDF